LRFGTRRRGGVVCRRGHGSLVRRVGGQRPVSMPVSTRPCRPSTKRATPGFIPPLRTASSELLRAHLRPYPFGYRRSARVPDPPRDITRARPPFAEPSRALLRSVLRRSQPLDGLLRSLASRLISSSSRVQGPIPFRGFSLVAAPSPSSGDASPMPLATRSLSEPFGSPSAPGASATRLFSAYE